MNAMHSSATLLLIGTLGACTLAPRYKVPDSAPAPAAYKESGDWKAAQPADERSRGGWWTVFQDPQLDALEAKVAGANQDLKAAFARLQQARAATRIARADLFPTLNAAAAADALAGFGQFADVSPGSAAGVQRFRPASGFLLRDRSMGPGAQCRELRKSQPTG